jgi:hypothetical protein
MIEDRLLEDRRKGVDISLWKRDTCTPETDYNGMVSHPLSGELRRCHRTDGQASRWTPVNTFCIPQHPSQILTMSHLWHLQRHQTD